MRLDRKQQPTSLMRIWRSASGLSNTASGQLLWEVPPSTPIAFASDLLADGCSLTSASADPFGRLLDPELLTSSPGVAFGLSSDTESSGLSVRNLVLGIWTVTRENRL
jgi:hypothetical protein